MVCRARVDGVEAGLRVVTTTLSSLGEKMDRLAELTLAVQRTAVSTASAVEVGCKMLLCLCIGLSGDF